MPVATSTGMNAVALGAYIPGAPSDPSKIDTYAALTGSAPRIVMWYQLWAQEFGSFDTKGVNEVRTRGAMPMISWDPWAGKIDDRDWSLATINGGRYDEYLRKWTRDVAEWGHPLYVRPMYEMNGWWNSWSPGLNGNTTDEFVRAWRRIVDIGREEGATNIRWVWSPNIDNGNPRLSSYASVYPGDDYVDWAGLDGFNWGTSRLTAHWRDLSETFRASVDKIRRVTPKPLMIAETSSSEMGGDKARWITTGFAQVLSDFPDVKAVIWFNGFDTRWRVDWRVDTSTSSIDAFRSVAASASFAGTLP